MQKTYQERLDEAHRFWNMFSGEIVPIQRDFPNCDKRNKCCEETWNPELDNIVVTMPYPRNYVCITNKTKKEHVKSPKDFEPKNS